MVNRNGILGKSFSNEKQNNNKSANRDKILATLYTRNCYQNIIFFVIYETYFLFQLSSVIFY